MSGRKTGDETGLERGQGETRSWEKRGGMRETKTDENRGKQRKTERKQMEME